MNGVHFNAFIRAMSTASSARLSRWSGSSVRRASRSRCRTAKPLIVRFVTMLRRAANHSTTTRPRSVNCGLRSAVKLLKHKQRTHGMPATFRVLGYREGPFGICRHARLDRLHHYRHRPLRRRFCGNRHCCRTASRTGLQHGLNAEKDTSAYVRKDMRCSLTRAVGPTRAIAKTIRLDGVAAANEGPLLGRHDHAHHQNG